MNGKLLPIFLLLLAFDVFYFRNKGLDGCQLIGQYGAPLDGIKNFKSIIGLGGERCDIKGRFVRIMLDPQNILDFQVKVPADAFSKAFGTGCLKNPFTGLGRDHHPGPEMLHTGVMD